MPPLVVIALTAWLAPTVIGAAKLPIPALACRLIVALSIAPAREVAAITAPLPEAVIAVVPAGLLIAPPSTTDAFELTETDPPPPAQLIPVGRAGLLAAPRSRAEAFKWTEPDPPPPVKLTPIG